MLIVYSETRFYDLMPNVRLRDLEEQEFDTYYNLIIQIITTYRKFLNLGQRPQQQNKIYRINKILVSKFYRLRANLLAHF